MKLLTLACFIFAVAMSCSQKKNGTENENQISAPPPVTSVKAFDYQPQAPVNGELNAVIELGSLGLNYFIVNIDEAGRWKLVKAEYGRSNIIYGARASGEIFSKITNFQSEIIEFGVNKENVYAVANSSFVLAKGINQLKSKLLQEGIVLKKVNPEQEAQFALIATIPKEFTKESYLVDIGSGNTKLSWISNGDTLSSKTYGSKYFLNNTQDTTVFREVRDAVLNIPEKNRNLCFLLGGAIYGLVKDEIKKSRYYILKPPSAYPKGTEKLNAGNVIYEAIYSEPTYSYIFDSQSNFSIGYLISLKKKNL